MHTVYYLPSLKDSIETSSMHGQAFVTISFTFQGISREDKRLASFLKNSSFAKVPPPVYDAKEEKVGGIDWALRDA